MVPYGKKSALESFTIAVYAVLLGVISYFHEPWFDESQAWLIARDSSLFDMIWNVLRYEGHTPLWYLSLFVPAKLGIPFELGLKTVNFFFATFAAAVFIKRAPFPLALRLVAPFTYFLFYQFGVISRCYSLFMLLLWGTAVFFPKRNERPFLFCLLLALLGGVTAYGMLIAFGIAIAWLAELIKIHCGRDVSFPRALAKTGSDRRFHSLVLLGCIHMFYVAMLWPMPDRHTPPLGHTLHAGEVIYRLLIAPVEAIFLPRNPDISSFNYQEASTLIPSMICITLLGILFVYTYKCGTFLYGILAYLSVAVFMASVFFSHRQSGIYILLTIFLVWISSAERIKNRTLRPAAGKVFYLKNGRKRIPRFKRLLPIAVGCILVVQLYWSWSASKNEIRFPYAPFRELASFIKDNGIEGRTIFDYYFVSNNQNAYFTNNTSVLSYFDGNIFYNHNPDTPHISYAEHRKLKKDALLQYLKSAPKPEFIIGHKYSMPFYDEVFELSDYEPVKSFIGNYIWKDRLRSDSIILYVRKDLRSQFPQMRMQTMKTDGRAIPLQLWCAVQTNDRKHPRKTRTAALEQYCVSEACRTLPG